mmetsp:Transcript_15976/g.31310  ORF Transcript_15976/g.31310 Transcript_15976/m.31310 type:complete len:268 (+) Transcript_15976:67-870(+)|eukprot:CAMPEP_0175090002 /NCGR_PEP_ID=MMETSP0086_2-20121207/1092_1 /TAXON_ID=136419 /ORGANISM="Unknown Unknown, Strain D1" /LENGTH=267 /DNA_ID=CAMNT_0016362559 /DNA_START=62 /DNA_END=865 /DNA_ORIENTATION=+
MSSAIVTAEGISAVETEFKLIEPDLRKKLPNAMRVAKELLSRAKSMFESPLLPTKLEVRVDELYERIKQYKAAIDYLGPLESGDSVQQRMQDDFESRQKEVKGMLMGTTTTPADTQIAPYGPRGSVGQLKQSNLFAVSPSTNRQSNDKSSAPSAIKRKQLRSRSIQKQKPNSTPLKTRVRLQRKPSLKVSVTPQSRNNKRKASSHEPADSFITPTNTPKQHNPNPHSKRKKRKPLLVVTARTVTPDAKKKLDVFTFSVHDPAYDPYV